MAHKGAREDLTAEYVRSILDYDPETGVLRWRWRGDVGLQWNRRNAGTIAGSRHPRDGFRVSIFKVFYAAHRLIWLMQTGRWPSEEIDHKDQNPHNNRWNNLREASASLNMANQRNRRSNNTSGYPGVIWAATSKKWAARICLHGKITHLGVFHTKEEAYTAYCTAAASLHGEFAKHHKT